MHVVLYGDSPRWTTGYANQLRWLAQWLQSEGHTVEQVALYPAESTLPLPAGSPPVHDQPGDVGWDVVCNLSADLLISLTDDLRLLDALSHPPNLPWIRWVAYDGDPLSWPSVSLLGLSVAVPVSPFGATVLRTHLPQWEGVVIPHALDDTFFRPPTSEEKVAAQQQLWGHSAPQVVGFVNRAIRRKALGAWFMVAAQLGKQFPQMHFVLRCEQEDEGVNYRELVDRAHLWDRLTWITSAHPLHGVNETLLRTVYWASDVLVHPSVSEGFGLTNNEARWCGVPVITSRFSAMADWGTADEQVPPAAWTYEGVWQTRQSVFAVDKAVSRLHRWFTHPEQLQRIAQQTRQSVAPTAQTQVAQQWHQAWPSLVEAAQRQRDWPYVDVTQLVMEEGV